MENTLPALAANYGFVPDGTDYFFGADQAAADRVKAGRPALLPDHLRFYQGALNYLLQQSLSELTVIVGVQPQQEPNGFLTVAQNPELITALATELHAYQTQARDQGKTLRFVVRYASEMNDVGSPGPYNARPAAYIQSIQLVRELFRVVAPEILFSFSPAIRADLLGKTPPISDYWPGDEVIDVLAGTWYVRGDQFTKSVALMKQYFTAFGPGRTCGLDEIGGAIGTTHNDEMLQRMFAELANLPLSFAYATIYLERDWGTDATLTFLRGT